MLHRTIYEQKEWINIDSLFQSYEKVLAMSDQNNIPEIEKASRKVAFLEIGKEQSKIPVHMLNEFCCDYSWLSYLETDNDDAADTFNIYNYSIPEVYPEPEVPLDADENDIPKIDMNLGISHTLCSFDSEFFENHNHNMCVYIADDFDSMVQDLYSDRGFFSYIYETSLSYYYNMQEELGLSEENTSKLVTGP